LNTLEKELYKYNLEPSNPIDFWKANKENYPILFNVFLRIFCIPATSVPSEQLFSAAGYSIWDRRNKISPQNVKKVMMLYQNLS
ncbi:zinc finger BED domain-containing 1-like, partial [Brachionus plicatilis]